MQIPQFTGHALSVMERISPPDETPAHWHYKPFYSAIPYEENTFTELAQQGIEPLTDDDQIMQAWYTYCLISQLHDVVVVHNCETGDATLCAHHRSIEYVKKYPILLSFSVPKEAANQVKELHFVPLIQFLPLPNHGEHGIMYGTPENGTPENGTPEKRGGSYNIHQLGESSRKLRDQLEVLIRMLGGRSKWHVYIKTHEECADDLRYADLRNRLQSESINQTGDEQIQTREHLRKLEKSHDEIVTLRESWQRPDWLAKWSEVCRMAQELAKDYYEHHQNVSNEPTYLFDQVEMKQIEKKKQPRPYSPQTFDETGYAPIVSALTIQAVINGINNAVSGADKWMFDETSGQPPYYPYISNNGSSIIMSYTDSEIETIPDSTIAKKLWNEVKSFNEQASDIILDIFSHLSRNLDDDGAAWFFASKHLDNRDITPITKSTASGKRRSAGYRKEDIQPISETLWKLENIWLTIHQTIQTSEVNKPKKKKDGTIQKPTYKQRQYVHQGRLLTIDQRWYQNDLTDEEQSTPFPKNSFAIGWHVRPGDWLRTFLETPNRQVAQLCKTLLTYDPYHQKWEKRIGKYLMFHGHMQCKGSSGKLTRTIQVILDDVSLLPENDNPKAYIRTREHLEKALNQLAKDHVIDGWKYTDKFTLSYGHKLEQWLSQSIDLFIASAKTQINAPEAGQE